MRSRLGDYQLLGPYGADGASARRWTANPPDRLGQSGPVVVTELEAITDAQWPVLVERVTFLAGIRSAHLPNLLETGRSDQDGEMVAWVSWSPRRARPATSPAPSRPEALRAVAGAARGAHDLHEAGTAHGAIGVSSILVGDGQGLLDPPLRSHGLFAPVTVMVRNPVDLDPLEPDRLWGAGPTRASDLWALAACAHSLLTGRGVHPALPQDQVVTAVQRVLMERPRIDAGLDAPLAQLLDACMSPDPRARPGSAAELAERLEALAGSR